MLNIHNIHLYMLPGQQAGEIVMQGDEPAKDFVVSFPLPATFLSPNGGRSVFNYIRRTRYFSISISMTHYKIYVTYFLWLILYLHNSNATGIILNILWIICALHPSTRLHTPQLGPIYSWPQYVFAARYCYSRSWHICSMVFSFSGSRVKSDKPIVPYNIISRTSMVSNILTSACLWYE